jgi:hypothetical protein
MATEYKKTIKIQNPSLEWCEVTYLTKW